MAEEVRTEIQEVGPKTEAGKKLIRWAEELEKWSGKNALGDEAFGVLGGLAVLGAGAIFFSNGVDVPRMDVHMNSLEIAKDLVRFTEPVRVLTEDRHIVAISISPVQREQLVDSLLNIEKFKSFKEGAAATFFLAGLGMAAVTRLGEKELPMKHSTSFVPGVAKAMASLGKLL